MNSRGGVHVNSMKPLWNRDRIVTLKYCQGVPKSNELPATARQRNCQELSTQNYCQGVEQSNILPLNATIKIRQESATNETSIMQVMQELKVLLGSIYGTDLVRKILSVSVTTKIISRKCNNQKHFQEVPQNQKF